MNTRRIAVVIPARMASTRFPGKPLAPILGLPMIEHVRRRVQLSKVVDEVLVATCDEEIAAVIRQFGGKAVMTASTHERCTDRVAEAAANIDADVIVNVQGDEPFIRPDLIDRLVEPMLADPNLTCTNLIAEIAESEAPNPNLVKTVFDLRGNALYFSREPIPSRKKAGNLPIRYFKQLGIISFRKDFLKRYESLPPTPCEMIESVDMMRLVEHGFQVKVIPVNFSGIGVDTPQDLENANQMMRLNPLVGQYL